MAFFKQPDEVFLIWKHASEIETIVLTQLFLSIAMSNTQIMRIKFLMSPQSNFQLGGSFQKLKCPSGITNNGQLALSYTYFLFAEPQFLFF